MLAFGLCYHIFVCPKIISLIGFFCAYTLQNIHIRYVVPYQSLDLNLDYIFCGVELLTKCLQINKLSAQVYSEPVS